MMSIRTAANSTSIHAFTVVAALLIMTASEHASAYVLPDAEVDRVPISEGYGGFTGDLKPYDRFGVSVTALGDLNGDGSIDLAVGAHTDDDGGVPHNDLGAVWILLMEPDGSGNVKKEFKISDLTAGMGGAITFGEFFGIGVAGPGDIDDNGTPDLVAGAYGWGPGTIGAVRVILLDWNDPNLSVVDQFIFNDATPSITLPANASFGVDVGTVGDLDGNGIAEIAVGSQGDGSGAVWILFLDWDPIGKVVSVIDAKTQKIAAGLGGFTGTLDAGARFGRSVAGIGDLDGDSVEDIVVGAGGQYGTGSVWILQLQSDGSVKPGSEVEIATGQQGFTQTLQSGGNFGQAVGWIGTHPGYTGGILFVGATAANTNDGLGYVIWLGPDGQVLLDRVIGLPVVGLPALGANGRFGYGAGALGDIDGDGGLDVAIGQYANGANGAEAGAIWVVKLAPCPRPIDGLPRLVAIPDGSGIEKCLLPSLEGSPITLPLYLTTAPDASTVGTLCTPEPGGGDGDEICAYDLRLILDGDLTIDQFTPASPTTQQTNEVGGTYPPQELRVNWIDLASPIDPTGGATHVGDLDVLAGVAGGSVRLGPESVTVGASAQLVGLAEEPIGLPEPGSKLGLLAGAALLAFLACRRRRAAASLSLVVGLLALQLATSDAARALEQSVLFTQRVGTNVPGLPGIGWWADEEGFIDVVLVGDVDDNDVEDLAVSTWAIGSCQCWRTHIVFMDQKGARTQQIGGQAIYATTPTPSWRAGLTLAPIGDRNDDGIPDLAISNDAGTAGTVGEGQLHLVYLDRFGREASRVEIDDADLTHTLEAGDHFSMGLDVIGDIDGDGIDDLVVGAYGDDDAANNAGAVYVLLLDDQEQVKADGEFKITTLGSGNAGSPTLQQNDHFGVAVTGIGDLDGNGTNDIAVGATGDAGGSTNRGAVWILFLDYEPAGPSLSVVGHTKIGLNSGGFSAPTFNGDAEMWFGRDVQWLRGDPGRGGEMIVSSNRTHLANTGGAYLLAIGTDGFVRKDYVIAPQNAASLGATGVAGTNWFGRSFTPVPDWNGDEVPDLLIGEQLGASLTGGGYIFHMKDSDHDGLDDNLDNCPTVHNPVQADGDDDGVGDLCDTCVDVANPANTVATDCNGDLDTTDPGEAVGEQCDVDDDGEGDACEPVEIQLVTTGTPGSPSWDLKLQCGGFAVKAVNGAIVLPAGITGTQTLTLSGASVGTSSTAGPGLTSPQRSDAIYFSAAGNLSPPDDLLCNPLDPPTLLGSLTSTGGIAGTQLAAAALTAEGVGTPGFGLNLAEDVGGAIPITAVRLVNGIPLPILDLELGPAVDTASGKRWEVLLRNATTEFHRVAFGLIAPFGTATGDMRWLGCESSATPTGARALVAGERSCTGGAAFGTTVRSAKSWTVGPQAAAPGDQLDHTLYVVLEGEEEPLSDDDTLNPFFGLPTVVLGTVELDGNPDLEPALTTDGINDIDNLFNAGTPVVPIQESDSLQPPSDPTQVKLIGEFNPADDVDSDGVQDLADNCPFVDNPTQTNRGSFLDATDGSDFLGDACQCAESTDDGAVLDPDDFDEIRAYLSGQITNPVIAGEIAERCSVAGTTECNMRDLLMLQLAIDAGDPSVATKCDAALSPVQGP